MIEEVCALIARNIVWCDGILENQLANARNAASNTEAEFLW